MYYAKGVGIFTQRIGQLIPMNGPYKVQLEIKSWWQNQQFSGLDINYLNKNNYLNSYNTILINMNNIRSYPGKRAARLCNSTTKFQKISNISNLTPKGL